MMKDSSAKLAKQTDRKDSFGAPGLGLPPPLAHDAVQRPDEEGRRVDELPRGGGGGL